MVEFDIKTFDIKFKTWNLIYTSLNLEYKGPIRIQSTIDHAISKNLHRPTLPARPKPIHTQLIETERPAHKTTRTYTRDT